MATAPPVDWITLTEASFVLRLSVDQVRRYADRGLIVGLRLPAGRVVSAASVERLARARAGDPDPAA